MDCPICGNPAEFHHADFGYKVHTCAVRERCFSEHGEDLDPRETLTRAELDEIVSQIPEPPEVPNREVIPGTYDVLLYGNGDRQMSHEFWVNALNLALRYGWQPKGVEGGLPEQPGLLESYLSGAGGLIASDDMRALGSAIQEALDDIPDCEVEGSDPLSFFSGDIGKSNLAVLARFVQHTGEAGLYVDDATNAECQ